MQLLNEYAEIELAIRELSRRHLANFVVYVDPFAGHEKKGYVFKPFHKIITDGLERIISGKIKKLIISVPPQHGKSTISSQRFPLYVHMLDQTLNIALASYSQDLSKSHLSKLRQLIEGKNFRNLGNLELISNTATSYELKGGGTFEAVGVGGSLTGKPVDLGIIDDIHKDRAEYESQTIRNGIWDRYTSVFLSRLHKDSRQVIIATRWGEDDLIGKIIALEGEEREVINIPVECGQEETIFPERFPYDFIQQKRKVMGERDYQSLYMGNPLNEGGGDFKREYFQYYRLEDLYVNGKIKPEYLIATFLDPAISQKQEADNTAIVTVAINQKTNDIYLLDVFADRIQPDNIIENLFRIVDKFKPNKVGIEIVAYQKMLALEIRKQMKIRNKFFVLEEVNPTGEKQARIKSMLQARYSNKSVYHLVEHKDLENELLKFPNGKHDDRIDAEAGAFRILDTICNYATEPVQPIRTDLETKKTNEDFSFNTYHKKLLSKSTNEYDEKGDIIESVVFG